MSAALVVCPAVPSDALVIVLALCLICLCAATAPAAEFHVSTQGNDAWSGLLPSPDADAADGPFATIERAQRAAREAKATHPDEAVRVLIHGGTYFLNAPLNFTALDGGTPKAPVIYSAYQSEPVTISGGVRITGWERTAQGWWQVTLPEVREQDWSFTQLFVNGERRFRPRLPESGYYYIARELAPSPAAAGRGFDRFGFLGTDLRPDWANLQDVEVLLFHQWSMSRLPIASVDPQTRTATLAGPTCATAYWAGLQRANRYLVDNVKEALGKPGQWYLDRQSGVLTYIPLPGESIEQAEIIAPRLETLVELRGDAELGMPVEGIELRGLTFSHANWRMPPQGRSFPQAEADLSGAIVATDAADCRIIDCTVTHVGAYAIDFRPACKRNVVEGCTLYDLGAGGVKLGGQGYFADETRAASHHRVSNNLIAQGGRLHPAAIGVFIGHSGYNQIDHNEIVDFYYTGISVGWQWSYAPSNAHHNLIARNDVHRIGQGVLSDMGGIYTLGPAEGTVIEFNRYHDIESYSYGGWGIYFDQATTGIIARNNAAYHTKTGGFHQHFGKDNIVTNNVFAFSRENQLQYTRAEEHRSFSFDHNIIYWDEGPLMSGPWLTGQVDMDHNIYWAREQDEITFAGLSLEQWREKGKDQHSIIEDPLFVDPDKGDFTLQSEEVVRKVGFEPFSLAETGLQTPRSVPPAPRAFPGPEPLPTLPLVEDFEHADTGGKCPAAQTYEDDETHVARVTEEKAASGSRSLKFTDGPAVKYSFNPHVYYTPHFRDAVVKSAFCVWLGPGSVMYHEWRNVTGAKWLVGPSIWVYGDGKLKANGKDLGVLPQSQWLRFETVCGIGAERTGTYSLTIRSLDGAQEFIFEDLPCDPGFEGLDWYGFCAHGEQEAVMYVDDIALGPVE